jgi:surface antigen
MSKLSRLSHSALLLGSMSTTVLATGCTDRPYSSPQEAAQNACRALGPKALAGALIGGLGGAALGAGVGLVTGLAVGSQADQRDCAAAQAALAQLAAQPIGVPAMWRSPSGSYGSYTPVSAEYAQGPQFCRQVRQTTAIAGHQPTESTGVACRQPNGDYQTMTETAANSSGTAPAVN